MDAGTVVDALNESSGRSLSLVRRLGGEAVGAWEVIDRSGRREVLKFSALPGWVAHFARVRGVSDHVRRRGYPTPRVTVSGVMANGIAYYLQEFASGRPLAAQEVNAELSNEGVELMLGLNRLQEGLAPPGRAPGQSWSDYLEACLWRDEHEWAELAALEHPEVSGFLADLRAFLGTNQAQVFVRDDLVTGSFEPHNILVDGNGVPTVVDLDAAGPGDRIIDMAALLRFDRRGVHAERITAEAARIDRLWPLHAARVYWTISSLYLATAAGHDPHEAASSRRRRLADLLS